MRCCTELGPGTRQIKYDTPLSTLQSPDTPYKTKGRIRATETHCEQAKHSPQRALLMPSFFTLDTVLSGSSHILSDVHTEYTATRHSATQPSSRLYTYCVSDGAG